jgi:hypothetical protein
MQSVADESVPAGPSGDRILAGLKAALRPERPVPPSPAGRRLRRLIVAIILAIVVEEALTVIAADTPGYGLFVRVTWALARVVGFLFLMRAVRFGRVGSRPFGLILAATTIFAVARLAQPRSGGLVPAPAVVVGFVVLTGLCLALVWMLYTSPAVHEHLSGRQVRRHIPGWVLTARVCALAYSALLFVPFFVAVGTAFGRDRRLSPSATLFLLGGWLVLALAVSASVPLLTFFVVVGQRWARWAVGTLSVVVLLLQPTLCYLLLGLDGLLRDGAPLVVAVVLALVSLHRSRGVPTWVRVARGESVKQSPS